MKTLLSMLFLVLSFLIQAQDVVLITKETVLSKVRETNNTIKMSYQDVLIANGDFRQTNAIVFPSIGISHTGIATTNPLMAFGAKLNQGIITQNDFNPDLLNNPSQIENYTTKIEVSQPIINLDGIYQRKAAKAKFQSKTKQLARTEDMIVLEVENTYMQLQLAYQTLEVLETAKKAAIENKRIAKSSFDQGYLQKADMLAIDVRVTEVENQLQQGKSAIKNVSNHLSVLMNDSTYKILKPIDSLRIVSDQNFLYTVTDNRPDIQALQYAKEAYLQQYKADKMAFLPRLNAFGNYELNDDQLFQGGTDGYLFGAQLSWNILEGTKRFGKAQKSKAELEKSKIYYDQYLAQSQLELNKARRMLQDAKSNLKLTALAMQQSKESFRIRNNRFKQGLEKTTDLLLAETQYSRKQLEYYTTIYRHNYALAYLKFLTKE